MAIGDYNVGDTGGGVSDLQSYLNSVGAGIAVDGKFGVETRAAVIRFQQARGIAADGIAGPQTLIELAKARAEGFRLPDVTVMPPMDISVPGPARLAAAGPDVKMLLLLVGLGIAAWYFMGRRGSGGISFGNRRPHPTDMEPEDLDDEEDEDEPEEEGDEEGDE